MLLYVQINKAIALNTNASRPIRAGNLMLKTFKKSNYRLELLTKLFIQ
jgi:hypothetical protein